MLFYLIFNSSKLYSISYSIYLLSTFSLRFFFFLIIFSFICLSNENEMEKNGNEIKTSFYWLIFWRIIIIDFVFFPFLPTFSLHSFYVILLLLSVFELSLYLYWNFDNNINIIYIEYNILYDILIIIILFK